MPVKSDNRTVDDKFNQWVYNYEILTRPPRPLADESLRMIENWEAIKRDFAEGIPARVHKGPFQYAGE